MRVRWSPDPGSSLHPSVQTFRRCSKRAGGFSVLIGVGLLACGVPPRVEEPSVIFITVATWWRQNQPALFLSGQKSTYAIDFIGGRTRARTLDPLIKSSKF
jgi:hypothetical protein